MKFKKNAIFKNSDKCQIIIYIYRQKQLCAYRSQITCKNLKVAAKNDFTALIAQTTDLRNKQLFEEKRTCAKFQNDILKTERLVRVYTDSYRFLYLKTVLIISAQHISITPHYYCCAIALKPLLGK